MLITKQDRFQLMHCPSIIVIWPDQCQRAALERSQIYSTKRASVEDVVGSLLRLASVACRAAQQAPLLHGVTVFLSPFCCGTPFFQTSDGLKNYPSRLGSSRKCWMQFFFKKKNVALWCYYCQVSTVRCCHHPKTTGMGSSPQDGRTSGDRKLMDNVWSLMSLTFKGSTFTKQEKNNHSDWCCFLYM